ncbi:MAG: hypothetical protein IJP38_08545, partial [Oscillospiraceae bacterium]|nr:hypothetical protein [Oscillospiraceae bacterium]
MSNRKFSRITSLLLIFCMLASFLPNVVLVLKAEAVDGAANDGMHFIFSAANWNKDATADISADDIKANGDADADTDASTNPVFASEGTDPWYIDGLQNINAYRLTSGTPDETYPNAKPNALYWNVKGTYFTPLG